MATWELTAEWTGSATTRVEAESEEQACAIGYQKWCGFNVEGGHVDFDITGAVQLDADGDPVTP